ncbi:MAG: type VI secretion system Vgr family protein [Acetobacteraceae bacterium]
MADFISPVSLLSMTSPLGRNVLVPTSFVLQEAMSEPFLGIIDLVSDRATIDPDKLLHQPVSVTMRVGTNVTREVRGLVRRFSATGEAFEREVYGYRAELVPPLWFLSQTEDCRVFEKKTTKDIVAAVLQDHGIQPVFRTASMTPRPFTMQYNESDLNFISRLMQEEGWFYFFHSGDPIMDGARGVPPGALVISDRVTTLNSTPPHKVALHSIDDLTTLAAWQPGRSTTFGAVQRQDYDPKPARSVGARSATRQAAAGSQQRTSWRWSARTLDNTSVAQMARGRMEAAEVEANLAQGTGFNPCFASGGRISVGGGGQGGGDFVLHSVAHQAIDNTWRNAADSPSYTNSFTAVPAALPWRPAQTARRPRMDGMYSAIVTGPSEQEIHTDELRRVKLQFRWDHRGDGTASNAAWVRVMQPWAGSGIGCSFIPRVGSEVAVAFMDGDLDRPVVIGQFYNGDNRPPWSPEQHKTRTGLRTGSTPNGASDEFSEFWFDDKKGDEQVMLHAQRDLTVEAENDATHKIGHTRTVTVEKGDDHLTVQQGNRTVDVTQGNHKIQSTSGDIVIKTAAGSVSIEAMQSLTLKVGQSSVTLDQSGVTIKGLMVKVEGQAMASLKGPLTELNADGMLKAAAGIMMLN